MTPPWPLGGTADIDLTMHEFRFDAAIIDAILIGSSGEEEEEEEEENEEDGGMGEGEAIQPPNAESTPTVASGSASTPATTRYPKRTRTSDYGRVQ